MPEQNVVSQWLNKHHEAQQVQKQNVQANSRIAGKLTIEGIFALAIYSTISIGLGTDEIK